MASVSAPRYESIRSTVLHTTWHSTYYYFIIFFLTARLVPLLDCKLLQGTRQCHVYFYISCIW